MRSALDLASLWRDRTALLSFIGRPYLWAYGGFLLVMVGLSFAIPGVHSAAMALRWPALGAAAVVGLALAASRGFRGLTQPQVWLALFIAMLAGSALYSTDKSYTAQRAISVGMLFAATFVGLYAYSRDWGNATRATDLLWCVGAALALAGLAFRAASGQAGERYEGLHSRATGAGSYAALFLPIAVYQASYRLKGGMRLLGWGVVALLLGQAALSGARAATLAGLVILIGLMAFYDIRKAILTMIAGLLLAPVPFLLNPEYATRLKEKSEKLLRKDSIATFTGRLDRWAFGIEQWRKRPVFGIGFGMSRTLAGQEDPRRFRIEPGETFNLHSDQIETLLDVGLVGWLPFGAFWLTMLALGVRATFMPRSAPRQLALAYLGAVSYAFLDTFMHGGFLAAGGGVSTFSWSMAALFLATMPRTAAVPVPSLARRVEFAPPPAASLRRPIPAPVPVRTGLPSARNLRRG